MSGYPIWYELMTSDPAGSGDFYREVLGWTVPPSGDVLPNGSEYAMIDNGMGGAAGGMLKLSDGMLAGGASPGWITYFDVPDVDASVAQATGMGAAVHMPPTTMPGVGRMAMIADPQGATFYLMAPTPPEDQPDAQSTVFSYDGIGRCGWNELNTDAAAEQVEFYTSLFDWEVGGEMPMPGEHIYKFMHCKGGAIGAIGSMKPDGMPNAWLSYFRVANIDAALTAIERTGGRVLHGPHEVPGEDHIIVAIDPAGARLGVVGKRSA